MTSIGSTVPLDECDSILEIYSESEKVVDIYYALNVCVALDT